jgi:hypothetical protein
MQPDEKQTQVKLFTEVNSPFIIDIDIKKMPSLVYI